MTVNESEQQEQPAPTPRSRWWQQIEWKPLALLAVLATLPPGFVWAMHALELWWWVSLVLTIIIIAVTTTVYYAAWCDFTDMMRKQLRSGEKFNELDASYRQAVAKRDDLERRLRTAEAAPYVPPSPRWYPHNAPEPVIDVVPVMVDWAQEAARPAQTPNKPRRHSTWDED